MWTRCSNAMPPIGLMCLVRLRDERVITAEWAGCYWDWNGGLVAGANDATHWMPKEGK